MTETEHYTAMTKEVAGLKWKLVEDSNSYDRSVRVALRVIVVFCLLYQVWNAFVLTNPNSRLIQLTRMSVYVVATNLW